MKLKEIAHARTGDKGDISNISVIPYDETDYEWLKQELTTEKVKDYFSEICHGSVVRYELDGIKALNFVMDHALGGGVTRSLSLDKHGKSLGMALLEMEVEGGAEGSEDTGEQPADKAACLSADLPEHSGSVREEEQTKESGGKCIRIGSGAGYAGDRLEPAMELIEKGSLDYLIFECLAERTVALGQQEKEKDPEKGYNPLLEYRMRRVLPSARKNQVRIITNMGAANPRAAADKVKQIAEELGIGGLKIACVTGDDITDRLQSYKECVVLENQKTLGEMEEHLISANAYMGAEGIVRALEQGAQVVITGRVSDPALTVGPLQYEFGWNTEKNPLQMGQAVLAGHLLECAGQVTGGYYADPGYKEVPEIHRLGFPLIEMDESGMFTITKVEGSGGCVTVDTCKEQTVYEIHDPSAYITPDAVADFSRVTYRQAGENRVAAWGAVSHGRPEKLKVSIGYKDCYIGEGEISYGGSNCLERARLAADILEKRIRAAGIEPEEFRVDYIGWNSLYGEKITEKLVQGQGKMMTENMLPEVRLRVSGRCRDRLTAELLADEVEALYTNGPAGGGGAVKRASEIVSIGSIFIPRDDVQVKMRILEPGADA